MAIVPVAAAGNMAAPASDNDGELHGGGAHGVSFESSPSLLGGVRRLRSSQPTRFAHFLEKFVAGKVSPWTTLAVERCHQSQRRLWRLAPRWNYWPSGGRLLLLNGFRKRKGKSLNNKQIRLVAAIAASAVIAAGAVAVSINQDRTSLGTDAQSNMSTGVTVTESDAPTTLSVAVATPAIKGPAPLPSEEQGLPG